MAFLLVPVSLYLLAAALIWALNRVKPNIGSSWLIAVTASAAVWVWTVVLHWRPDSAFYLQSGRQTFSVQFILDNISWPYMMAVSVLVLLLMLTAPSAMVPQHGPKTWIFYLVISAAAYGAVCSGGVWSLIFCWTFFDVLDVGTRYFQSMPHELTARGKISVSLRLIGTLLAAVALAMSASNGDTATAEALTEAGSGVMLFACALRLGVFPFPQFFQDNTDSRITLGMMLQMASVIIVIPILNRLPLAMLAPNMAVVLSIFVGVTAFVGAVGWILSEDNSEGYAYAVMAVSCMAFISTLRNQQHAAIVWGVSVVFVCGPLALYRTRSPLLSFFPIFSLLFLSGLPFMPNAIGWFGLVAFPFSLLDLIFLLVQALLLAGGFKLALQYDGIKFSDLEPWMRTVYPLGFSAALISHLLVCMLNWEYAYSMGYPWASFPVFFLGLLIGVLTKFMPENEKMKNLGAWTRAGADLYWNAARKVLEMEWFRRMILAVAGCLDSLLKRVSDVLESPAGLIWELLFLAMLVAAIFGGG